jgi:hypothetical protein
MHGAMNVEWVRRFLNYDDRYTAEVSVEKPDPVQLCEVMDDEVLRRRKDVEGTGRGPVQDTNPKYPWRNRDNSWRTSV